VSADILSTASFSLSIFCLYYRSLSASPVCCPKDFGGKEIYKSFMINIILSSWKFWKNSWLKCRKIKETKRKERRRGNQLNMGLKGKVESNFNNVIKNYYFPWYLYFLNKKIYISVYLSENRIIWVYGDSRFLILINLKEAVY
jgi:hypothetical protein